MLSIKYKECVISAKLSSKFQLAILKGLPDRLDLKAGQQFTLIAKGNVIGRGTGSGQKARQTVDGFREMPMPKGTVTAQPSCLRLPKQKEMVLRLSKTELETPGITAYPGTWRKP